MRKIPKQRFKPLNIGRIMIFDKNRKIYGMVIESKRGLGFLRRLCELAEDLGVVIQYVQFSMMESGKSFVRAIAFLDFSDSTVSPERALELVKSQEFVISSCLIKPDRKGIIFDNCFFPLIISNERIVIFRKAVYEALFNGVRMKFGSAGEAMLYYQGFTIGFEIYNKYLEIANSEELEDLIEVAKALNMTLGWGVIDKIKVDTKNGVAKLRIYQSFECELGKSNGKPYSQFYRGAIAGLFTRFFGKEVKIQETKCIAKGDPYCEFTIKT